jgi:hypothetical protein
MLDFVKEAVDAGIQEDTARKLSAGEPSQSPPANVTGRGRRAWDRYRSRLGDLASAEDAFKDLAQGIKDAHAAFIYPVMVLFGEQGSAKSTFSEILRALVDPNTAPLRALPREDRDLFIAASNGHVLAFDNVSGLPAWISDTLCRLATGGGFAVRQLYTDQDEVLFDASRPVILNGIEDIVTRPDLADRALFLTLEPIPEDRRRSEQELWTAFETERPRILGVPLDALVEGLKRLPATELEKLPRMADFALWATACETALWPAGTFWSAYCGNRDEAVEGVIDADPIATAVAKVPNWVAPARQYDRSDIVKAVGRIRRGGASHHPCRSVWSLSNRWSFPC